MKWYRVSALKNLKEIYSLKFQMFGIIKVNEIITLEPIELKKNQKKQES